MNDLEMCKAFAELEGVELIENFGKIHDASKIGKYGSEYDPIDSLALNCAARDKYEVSINHCTQFDCGIDGSGSFDIPFVIASIKSLTGDFECRTPLNEVDSDSICMAAIECILKSKGMI